MNNPLTKLKDPRTNWKYILIVVILAFVMGGGIFWFELQVTNELISLIEYPKIRKPEKVSLESSEENFTPRQVVQKFIEADMAGARLGGEVAKEAPNIEKYIGGEFFDPGYDFAMVIKGYKILDEYPSENENSYFVKVKYFCKEGAASGSMGIPNEVKKGPFVIVPCDSFFKEICPFCFLESKEISSTITFDLKEETETVIFKLIRENGKWKINSPSIWPHISEETFKKQLESFK